jgi:hypothetical protein
MYEDFLIFRKHKQDQEYTLWDVHNYV